MKVTFSERSACAKFDVLLRLFFVGGFLCSRFGAWGLGFRLWVLLVFFWASRLRCFKRCTCIGSWYYAPFVLDRKLE